MTTPSPKPTQIAPATAASIAELGVPDRAEHAVGELERLGDPAAIPALGDHYARTKQPRVLEVVVTLARKGGWQLARPILERVLAEADDSDAPTLDAAVVAAGALAQSGLPVLGPLATAALRPAGHRVVAQIAAIRAIGVLSTDKAQAVAVLGKLLGRPQPAMTERDAWSNHLALSGAAINAIAQLRDPSALPILLPLPLEVPELMTQLRRAFVATGRTAIPELRSMLRGTHPTINALIARRKLDRVCGADPADCQQVAPAPYYAATLLADQYATDAAPDLIAELRRPPLPAYAVDDDLGPVQHLSVGVALGKLGVAQTARELRDIWRDRKFAVTTRVVAALAYSYAARDATAVGELGKICFDNAADDALRTETALAYGRLSRDPKDLGPLFLQADKYVAAATKKRVEADRAKPAADASDRRLAAARQALDAAKLDVLVKSKDPNASAAAIRSATAAARAAEDAWQLAKKAHRDDTQPYKSADRAARDYTGFARMFQNHAARIDLAITCRDDPTCYLATLRWTPADATERFAKRLPSATSWTAEERDALLEAYIDRSMLELGKLEQRAQPAVDAMLEAVATDRGEVRRAILMALPKIVRAPCETCVVALDRALAASEGKPGLSDIHLETQIVRAYFAP